MAYNAKTGQIVPDEQPGDFPTYGTSTSAVPSANDQRLQSLTDSGWTGSVSAEGKPVGDLAVYQAKKPQAVVDSGAAKTDLSKIQTDFQSLLASISNKQQYNLSGLNPNASVVDLMKSKGISDTSANARATLAQQAGITDYNPSNAESNKKLADAIMNSKAVGSTMSQMTPGTPEYDNALSKVSSTISNAQAPTAPVQETLTSTGTKASEDPLQVQYDQITKQIDENNASITNSLNQLRNGTIPLTADQQAVVDSTQQSFNNAIAQQKSANQAQENIVKQSSFRSGSEYTPEVSSSIIKNVIDANVLKISEYDQKAIASIAQLKNDFKTANYKAVKEGYDTLQATLKDKQDNMLALMKMSHEYEQQSLDYNLKVQSQKETARHNQATEAVDSYKAGIDGQGNVQITGPNADALNVILGSGKFTKEQTKLITNSINNGEDPVTVIKNQAKQLLSGPNQSTLEKSESSLYSMQQLDTLLKQYYAAGGDTGIFEGTDEKIYQKLGQTTDPVLANLGSQISGVIQKYRHDISGTAYSDAEGKQIAAIFPDITKGEILNSALVQAKISGLKNDIDGFYSGVLGSNLYNKLKTGQSTTQNAQPITIDNNFTQNMINQGKSHEEIQQAIKDAKEYNSSLGNVGGDTKQALNVQIPQSSRLAYVNNNPGNLKFAGQAGAVKGENGFAKFSTPEEGANALLSQIKLDASRGLSLNDFVNKFAPPSENNTKQYIQQIASALGATANTLLTQLDLNLLTKAIAHKESGTQIA